MPELAEVDFFRRRWQEAAPHAVVLRVLAHERARPLREVDGAALRRAIVGSRLVSSETAAKQMAFRFSRGAWLGLHLGMSGELRVEAADYVPGRHDHLVLYTSRHALVYHDPRMFGRVQFQAPSSLALSRRGEAKTDKRELRRGESRADARRFGLQAPDWWTKIAPPILGPKFTVEAVAAFLRRRARAPLKAVLLMQERFPGIGNWMADEILWRAALHPRRPAGSLQPAEVRALWRECRQVCRMALRVMGGNGGPLPPSHNFHIPHTWLFRHRWEAGGRCPRTGVLLRRATIGGRTTCWSPARQTL
jgi:formamidopyrimidine-DNA glycosylase